MASKICKKCNLRYYLEQNGFAYIVDSMNEPIYYINGKPAIKHVQNKSLLDRYDQLKFCSSSWYNSKEDIGQQCSGNIVGYSFRPRGQFNIYTKKG